MNQIFTAFIEHKEFKKSHPWTVVKQIHDTSVISTPHYAETIEILLCNNINGLAYIGGRRFEMSGRKVFYIAPQTVHSFEYHPSGGFVLVIKLHPNMLKAFIDIKNVLEEYGASLSSLDIEYENYDDFNSHIEFLSENTDISSALCAILSIFHLLVSGTSEANSSSLSMKKESSISTAISEIIEWTEQNFSRKISLDEVADRFGYTKNYFCDMFKKRTGITYLHYLNNVRISSACTMLRTGIPVKSVSRLCGFETDSYFISLFKKTIGITPKAYQTK